MSETTQTEDAAGEYVEISGDEKMATIKTVAYLMMTMKTMRGPAAAAKFGIGHIEGLAVALRQLLPLSEILKTLEDAAKTVTSYDAILKKMDAAEAADATKH